jgi:hypothetical protein
VRNRLFLATALWAFAVFAFWWSGWQPGFIDAGAIERLSRLRGFELTTDDPALYTTLLWLVSIGGRSAALATLLQGAAWAALAGLWAVRLNELGASRVPAGLAVGLVAALPATAVSMLGLWPQSVVALAAGWLLLELAASEWTRPRSMRTGVALGCLAALGLVGLVAALVVAIVIVWGDHAAPGEAALRAMAVAVGVAVIGYLVLPFVMGMERGHAATAVIAPVIASALTHHSDDFPTADLEELTAVADVDLWQQLYRCEDPTPLLEDRDFDETAISASRMRSLGFGAFVRHPFSAVGQRICATAGLMAPALPADTRFYLPEYTVFPNMIGVSRDPVFTRTFDATKAVLIRTQQTDRQAWWWRPALPVAAGGLAFGLLAAKRRRMAMGAALLGGLFLGTFLAGPRPEFEVALPLYVVGWLSATLFVTLRRL